MRNPAAASRLIFVAAVAGAAGTTTAQTVPPATADEAQKVIVTGSNIKRIDGEGVSPVQVIRAEDIRRSGLTTVTEVLRSLPAAGGNGLSDSAGSNSFSTGASSISLRGLGSQSTLVLLNGRRIAPFAPADPNAGQASAVNIDSLPLDVVDRIEVLANGASAIYGSEAIAGVVNVITKQEFRGGIVGGGGSINTRGNYRNASGNVTYGIGDLSSDNYNVFVNLEFTHRNRTPFRDDEGWLIYPQARDSSTYRVGQKLYSSYSPTGNYYDAAFDPATLGSAFYSFREAAPGCPTDQLNSAGQCRFDIWPYLSIQDERETVNLFTRGTLNFSNTLSGFAEIAYGKTRTLYTGSPQVYGDVGSWYASATGQVVNVPEVLPPGHPNNPTDDYIGYRHRFTEVGPRDDVVDTEAWRLVSGLKGTLWDWDYESALSYSQNNFRDLSKNQIRSSALTSGILDGTYNFLDPQAGTLKPDDLRLNSVDTGKSYYAMLDFKASHEFGRLAGGPIGTALGAEFRHEGREATPDVNKTIGEVLSFGAASADGSRNVSTAYGELSLPFVRDVQMQLAARADHYSDYGTSVNPKVALGWKVTPRLSLRAGYETGFRAPSLTEIAKSDVSAFTTVTDPKRCITGEEDDCSRGVGLLIKSNPDLKPEKSRGFNLGIVLEPIEDLSASLDYFDIQRRQQVDTLSTAEILRNEDSTDPKYAGRVKRGPVDPDNPDLPGQIQSIDTGYFNLGKTQVAGFDLDLRYALRLAAWGKLSAGLKSTYYTQFKQSSDETSPLVSYLGFVNKPRIRSALSLAWEYAGFTAGVSANYVGPYKTFDPVEVDSEQCDFYVGTLEGACRVASWTTWDLSFVYERIKNLSLGLVVRNVADRKPPFDAYNSVGGPYYNADQHNPYGRYFNVSAKYTF